MKDEKNFEDNTQEKTSGEETTQEERTQVEEERETSGEYLYNRLGIVGCIAVLLFTAIVIITCFTSAP